VPAILLIDDNALQLCIRETVLRDAGFSVVTASTAAQALAFLSLSDDLRVDAIVTDHVMPRVRGSEFVQTMRAMQPHIPLIENSGLPEDQSEYAGHNVPFLRKPCRPDELIRQLKNCLSVTA